MNGTSDTVVFRLDAPGCNYFWLPEVFEKAVHFLHCRVMFLPGPENTTRL